MRGRPLAITMLVLLLAAVACRGESASQEPVAPAQPPTRPQAPDPISVIYTQHALAGANETIDAGNRLTLLGVDQVTTWMTDSQAGVFTTGDFVTQWEALGLEDEPPQAVLVSAAADGPRMVVELSEPTWNPFFLALTYQTRPAADIDPRLAPLVEGQPAGDLPATFGGMAVYILQPDAPQEPSDATTTTTTTTSTTLPPDGATTVAPTTLPSSPSASPTPTLTPQPTPAPTSALPPAGPAFIVVAPTDLTFPIAGGLRTVTLQNIGSGVGSWSAKAQNGTGMTVTPSSGVILPGSNVVVQISYNGHGPAPDFQTEVQILAPNGTLFVSILVAG